MRRRNRPRFILFWRVVLRANLFRCREIPPPRNIPPCRLSPCFEYLYGDDDGTHPAATARVEIGFRLQTRESHEHYWINWIEPERELLVGWHQDDTHDDLGPVHLQVNDGATAVDHRRAQFIDSHRWMSSSADSARFETRFSLSSGSKVGLSDSIHPCLSWSSAFAIFLTRLREQASSYVQGCGTTFSFSRLSHWIRVVP